MSVVSCSQQLPSLAGQVRGMESSAMAIDPQQPIGQSGNLDHSIMSIDNHWQDLELLPFSSQAEVQPSTSFGSEERQPTGVDEYNFDQHDQKYFHEAPHNGSHQWLPTGLNQAVQSKTSASISSPGAPNSGMQKMQPRLRHSQRKPSPRSTKAESDSLPSVTDNELASPNQMSPSNQLTKIQSGARKAIANKRTKQTVEPTPLSEPSTESSNSVRSKMRESLAAALKLISDELNNDAASEGKENLSATTGTLDKAQEVVKSGDVSADQMFMKKDDIQSSSRLSSAYVDSEGCEDKDGHVSKKVKLTHSALNEIDSETPQRLASEIENELYRLFGGVNKKYKEKGRSLLFNLKDRHNPELRRRVFAGEISPSRLCSMTAEELASKELTQWRIAKAEELAQMVVLPDSDKEFKSFVKKTHKGEVEVEVERDDSVSVEVVLAGNAFLKSGYKDKEAEEHNLSNSSDKPDSDSKLFDNPTLEKHENTDLMQDLVVEEFSDSGETDSLPDVPTLDEFMKDLDSEPPFQNILVGAMQGSHSSEKGTTLGSKATRNTAACNSEAMVTSALEISRKTGTPQAKPAVKLDVASTPSNITAWRSETSPVGREGQATLGVPGTRDSAGIKPSENDAGLISGSSMNNALLRRSLSGRIANTAVRSEPVWDGLIQLNISSLVTVLGFYKSGAKASIKEWPSFLEIKGRVRLDCFEKFLQDLRLCRSRAIMILQLCWKEGSPESGRVKLCETIESYVADERVGFAEPLPGLELYFCPPHPSTTQILRANLSKEHAQAVAPVHDGFICVAVWRKSPAASPDRPRLPPSSSFSSLLEQQRPAPNNVAQDPNVRNHHYHSATIPLPETTGEMEDDDIPPGFGPSAMAAARDVDDLPEFDFVQSTGNAAPPPPGYASSKLLNHHHHQPTTVQPPAAAGCPPVDHFRELINKYGHNQKQMLSRNVMTPAVVDVDDDDDDIPEWQPHQHDSCQLRQPPPQHPYTRPPPPPPPLRHHYNQQPNQMMMPPNEHLVPPPASNYNPREHQPLAAVGQWAHGSGAGQPWHGATPPTQQQYLGGPPPLWRPAAATGLPQHPMGRSRGGHFPRDRSIR